MSELVNYIRQHTSRGECKCNKCCDVGNAEDPQGHTADLVFFKVALQGEPDVDVFRCLIKNHKGVFADIQVLDGTEHNYIQLGGWLGDQGLALQFMGLGTLLGLFNLITPDIFANAVGPELKMEMAQAGYLSICCKTDEKQPPCPPGEVSQPEPVALSNGEEIQLPDSETGRIRRVDVHGDVLETRDPGDDDYDEWGQLFVDTPHASSCPGRIKGECLCHKQWVG